MTFNRRCPALLLGLVLAAGALAPGCTGIDDYVSGTPFTLDQPLAEVTLEGEIHADLSGGEKEGCVSGGTVLWGSVRNTGDLDVDDVSIEIDAYDGAGLLLGSFRTRVYSGTVQTDDEGNFESAETMLIVDDYGTFEVCTTLAAGSVARTEHRTGEQCRLGPCFTVIDDPENQ